MKRIGLLVAMVLLLAPAASAASPWADETTYGSKAVSKLGYGLKNVLFGWTEIITQPKDVVDAGDNVLVGIGQGVVNAVGQTVGGALHLVTFPITNVDIPLPEGGTDVL